MTTTSLAARVPVRPAVLALHLVPAVVTVAVALALTPILAFAVVLVPMEAALLAVRSKPRHRYLMIVSSVTAIGLGLALLIQPGVLLPLAIAGLTRQLALLLLANHRLDRAGAAIAVHCLASALGLLVALAWSIVA